MADSCYVCGTEKSLDNCITCEKPVCKSHAGHMKNYYSGDGKKGRACQNCIDEGLANPDYGLSDMHLVVPDAVKRFENKIYPRIHNDLAPSLRFQRPFYPLIVQYVGSHFQPSV